MTATPNAKERLYLALYLREGVDPHSQDEDRHHWAFLVLPGPNARPQAKAIRIHARNYFSGPDQTRWMYEELRVSPLGTPKLLCKTFIGYVSDEERFYEILRDAPIKQAEGWNCVSWIDEAWGLLWEEEGVVEGGPWELEVLKREVLGVADEERARREAKIRPTL